MNNLTVKDINALERITSKHRNRAMNSNKETAHQDCERLGMDEVQKYCRANNLPVTGAHIHGACVALLV